VQINALETLYSVDSFNAFYAELVEHVQHRCTEWPKRSCEWNVCENCDGVYI